ncbi:uncharacterized protein DUF3558 [Herbihabitans rhizosphaerae]|uniref:Uncharacterized protein DUF3558 n=1 Tax=Herbihabitans rhizosphaerae TaxID=1872711 RepID=A0A4Q7KIS5_9PSEU|nr:DUF3558 family protein [Herbihabitans rhizosphaerae]RZS34838.1 uncharacterized protein DUF3558 [Herbihabitans rhizosphaerae]
MGSTMRAAVLAALALTVAANVSGCGDSDKGSTPGGSASETTKGGDLGSDSTGAGKAGKNGPSILGVDPCTLVKPADAADLYQEYKPRKGEVMKAPACIAYDYTLRIESKSFDKLKSSNYLYKNEFEIAGRRAAQAVGGVCKILLEVNSSETLELQVSISNSPPAPKDEAKACGAAKKGLEAAASRLPS